MRPGALARSAVEEVLAACLHRQLADAAVVGVAGVKVAVAGPDRVVYVGFAFGGAGVRVVGVGGAAAACGAYGEISARGREAEGAGEEDDVRGLAEPLGPSGGAEVGDCGFFLSGLENLT
jgi:hypothetical protein